MTDYGEITIQGNTPSKSNCYKIIQIKGYSSLGKTKALKDYEDSFMWQIGSYRNLHIDRPFEFYIDVYYPSKRSDLDNALKIVLDCLQRTDTITNDNNCCKIVARKFIDKEHPRIVIRIVAID